MLCELYILYIIFICILVFESILSIDREKKKHKFHRSESRTVLPQYGSEGGRQSEEKIQNRKMAE